MEQGSSRAKALRRRDELLDVLGELEGQLSSALMTLSWTLAVSSKHPPKTEDTGSPFVTRVSKAHLMVILGASIGAPKSRTIMELDRFEVKPFGWREDWNVSHSATTSSCHHRGEDGAERGQGHNSFLGEDSESISSSDTASGTEDCDEGASEEYTHAQSGPDEGSDDPGSEADVALGSESQRVLESGTFTPISPSTFVRDGTLPLPASPNSKPTHHLDATPMQHPSRMCSSPPLCAPVPAMVSESDPKKAERALYRTLAADIDNEELPTTTMFLLLRAPRSFHHPHWIPRQDYSRPLDLVTQQLFQPIFVDDKKGNDVKKFVGGMRTGNVRGVRMSCQVPSTLQLVEDIRWDSLPNTIPPSTGGDEEEGNEMIWWQWEGKVRGIGDDMFI